VAALGVPCTCSGLAGATVDAASDRLDGVDEVVHAGAAPETLGVELAAADALGVLDAVLAAARKYSTTNSLSTGSCCSPCHSYFACSSKITSRLM
jgi:hypothetical protein